MANPGKNLISCMILFATFSICLAQSCHLVENCFKNTAVGTTGDVLEHLHVNPFDVGTLTTIETIYCTGDFCTRYKECLQGEIPSCGCQVVAPYFVLESMINLVCRQGRKMQNTCLGRSDIQHMMRSIFVSARQEIDNGKCSVYEQFRHILNHSEFSQYCSPSDLHFIIDLFNANMRPYSEAAGCLIMI